MALSSRRAGLQTSGNEILVRCHSFSSRRELTRSSHAAVSLGKALFPMFALALNLEETFFDDKVRKVFRV